MRPPDGDAAGALESPCAHAASNPHAASASSRLGTLLHRAGDVGRDIRAAVDHVAAIDHQNESTFLRHARHRGRRPAFHQNMLTLLAWARDGGLHLESRDHQGAVCMSADATLA